MFSISSGLASKVFSLITILVLSADFVYCVIFMGALFVSCSCTIFCFAFELQSAGWVEEASVCRVKVVKCMVFFLFHLTGDTL